MSVDRTSVVVGGHSLSKVNNSSVHSNPKQAGYHGVDIAQWGVVGFQKLPCVFLLQIVSFILENLMHDIIHRYGKEA